MKCRDAYLNDVCSLITDGKHGDCRNECDSGYYFISAKDVRNGKINYENARQITKDDFEETHRRTNLEPGDILLTNSGTIGRLAIAPENEVTSNTTFQKSVAILKPIKETVLSNFLYYSLLFNKSRLINAASGSAQKNLLLGQLRKFPISLPNIKTQQKIASILSTYDDLIENNLKRIKLLEEAAQLLYKKWFVDFKFPNHEKTKFTNGIPKGWEKKLLCKISEINARNIKNKTMFDTINYIDISSVATGIILNKTTYRFSEAPGRAKRMVNDGDIIWSNVRPNRKSYSLVLDPLENDIVSTGFTVISATNVPYTFLYNAVTTDEFVGYLINNATGAAYPAVKGSDFEKAIITVPSGELLKAFHRISEPMHRNINYLLKLNQRLKEARDLLLPRLMEGSIEV